MELRTRRDSKFDDAILDESGDVVYLDDIAKEEITPTKQGSLNSYLQLPINSQGTRQEVSNATSYQGTVTLSQTQVSPLSSQLDQLPQITVCQVESPNDSPDLDPGFNERFRLRKEKYDRFKLACEDLANSGEERIATSIKLTLARMTKNYYKDFFSKDTSPEVPNQIWSRHTTASCSFGEKRKESMIPEGQTVSTVSVIVYYLAW